MVASRITLPMFDAGSVPFNSAARLCFLASDFFLVRKVSPLLDRSPEARSAVLRDLVVYISYHRFALRKQPLVSYSIDHCLDIFRCLWTCFLEPYKRATLEEGWSAKFYTPQTKATHPFRCKCSRTPTFLAMNSAFPAGTRIFYWNGAGQTVYGTVQRAARAADGTVVLEIRLDATGGIITLPAASVSRV